MPNLFDVIDELKVYTWSWETKKVQYGSTRVKYLFDTRVNYKASDTDKNLRQTDYYRFEIEFVQAFYMRELKLRELIATLFDVFATASSD